MMHQEDDEVDAAVVGDAVVDAVASKMTGVALMTDEGAVVVGAAGSVVVVEVAAETTGRQQLLMLRMSRTSQVSSSPLLRKWFSKPRRLPALLKLVLFGQQFVRSSQEKVNKMKRRFHFFHSFGFVNDNLDHSS